MAVPPARRAALDRVPGHVVAHRPPRRRPRPSRRRAEHRPHQSPGRARRRVGHPRAAAVAIDTKLRRARVGAGVRWQQVVEATAPHGLAPLNGSSATVGVVGYPWEAG
ncbi:FAD-binding protein [Micromonospora sp. WMMA1363]|uniref:FAD-binding protein n=1 Tax=Micromonospora sp. WMMA1363 TaxID=3053985 RepID=UPI00259D2A40|nr:FAD-binding protein [Micromonospora sp. WMMA1363]MDM4722178.1 FAD-binding protein [Micromonospora sp. WMMA1363]